MMNADTVFTECKELAQAMTDPDPHVAVHDQYVRRVIVEHFAWMQDESTIQFATGALAAFLSQRGWYIIFADQEI